MRNVSTQFSRTQEQALGVAIKALQSQLSRQESELQSSKEFLSQLEDAGGSLSSQASIWSKTLDDEGSVYETKEAIQRLKQIGQQFGRRIKNDDLPS